MRSGACIMLDPTSRPRRMWKKKTQIRLDGRGPNGLWMHKYSPHHIYPWRAVHALTMRAGFYIHYFAVCGQAIGRTAEAFWIHMRVPVQQSWQNIWHNPMRKMSVPKAHLSAGCVWCEYVRRKQIIYIQISFHTWNNWAMPKGDVLRSCDPQTTNCYIKSLKSICLITKSSYVLSF